ncbi:hypothetical protein EMPG_09611 [Blastomyces silverae]|uniref:Release factor glutamine methyltransferase N-terminal domain-containing protein n=1 Tax=Blastomyces silverae TaxID=2060906 RepID=A0A0H1BL52_9EURO|nr:hypothetical protein EMPG_09611 [Blastomyces silverae]
MPRLSPSLLRHAYSLNPLLPLLLRECRDLPSAQNELRWLSEYASAEGRGTRNTNGDWRGRKVEGWPMAQGRHRNDNNTTSSKSRLREMVQQRARGVPLQYILGDQPFGELEILCRRGVLIPRPETEAYTTRVANLLLSKFAPAKRKHHKHELEHDKYEHVPNLRILDLCTGTGCIPLLLHSLLSPVFPKLQLCGVDISPRALRLARENLKHNIKLGRLDQRAREEVSFVRADVLSDNMHAVLNGVWRGGKLGHITTAAAGNFSSSSETIIPLENSDTHTSSNISTPKPTSPEPDTNTVTILLSNPPYISPAQFTNGTTARSVRKFEPKLALVPPPRASIHHHHHQHQQHGTKTGTDTTEYGRDTYPSPITDCNRNNAAAAVAVGVSSTHTTSEQRHLININEIAAASQQEDIFYPLILSMGLSWVGADLVVLECGDKGQAGRVSDMAKRLFGGLEYGGEEEVSVEVWGGNSYGFGSGSEEKREDCDCDGDGDGYGGARAVVVRRGGFVSG